MVENKYIGLLLAMTSSVAVGTSTVVQKMVGHTSIKKLFAKGLTVRMQGLNAAGSGQATSTEDMSYLRNPVWWLGFTACACWQKSGPPIASLLTFRFVCSDRRRRCGCQTFRLEAHSNLWRLAFNFAAYTFAPPVMVTPLGAFSVIIGCAA